MWRNSADTQSSRSRLSHDRSGHERPARNDEGVTGIRAVPRFRPGHRLIQPTTLEKVTEKIDKISVFGGLDAVLKDLVKIR